MTRILLALVLGVCVIMPAQAAVVGVAGGVTQIDPPPLLPNGAFENDSTAYLFAEKTSVLLEANLAVDLIAPGQLSGESGGTIAIGTEVDSFYVYFDPVSNETVRVSGTITFDKTVLGIIGLWGALQESDSILGAPQTAYLNVGAWELEIAPNLELVGVADGVFLSEDRRTVSFDIGADQFTDAFRVVTSTVIPLPPAAWLFGSALGLLGWARKATR